MLSSLLIFAIFFFLLVSIMAVYKTRHNKFYQDTTFLWPFGIYVWGDALIVAPFLATVSLIWLLLGTDGATITKFIALSLGVRSFFEVIYWLNHQATDNVFTPLLLRNNTSLKPKDTAILFQVWHTCIVIASAAYLLQLF